MDEFEKAEFWVDKFGPNDNRYDKAWDRLEKLIWG